MLPLLRSGSDNPLLGVFLVDKESEDFVLIDPCGGAESPDNVASFFLFYDKLQEKGVSLLSGVGART